MGSLVTRKITFKFANPTKTGFLMCPGSGGHCIFDLTGLTLESVGVVHPAIFDI